MSDIFSCGAICVALFRSWLLSLIIGISIFLSPDCTQRVLYLPMLCASFPLCFFPPSASSSWVYCSVRHLSCSSCPVLWSACFLRCFVVFHFIGGLLLFLLVSVVVAVVGSVDSILCSSSVLLFPGCCYSGISDRLCSQAPFLGPSISPVSFLGCLVRDLLLVYRCGISDRFPPFCSCWSIHSSICLSSVSGSWYSSLCCCCGLLRGQFSLSSPHCSFTWLPMFRLFWSAFSLVLPLGSSLFRMVFLGF